MATRFTDPALRGVLTMLEDIRNAPDLRELNNLLTESMARREIQGLVKDDNLDVIVDTIVHLTAASEPDDELLAAAMLGRLSAVARGRESSVYRRVEEIFTKEPPSIETLSSGDEKAYAAVILRQLEAEWLDQYLLRQVMAIDTADNARREILITCLERMGSIAKWLSALSKQAADLQGMAEGEARLKRARRILGAMSDVLSQWRGDVGEDIGEQIATCCQRFIKPEFVKLDEDALCQALDNLLSILNRVIELRFSTALYPSTYLVIEEGKRICGSAGWRKFVENSERLPVLRIVLLESALVLARQNRTDRKLVSIMSASYASTSQLTVAIKNHFEHARDLDPDVARWWCGTGDQNQRREKTEHKVGNTEDSQIGALLIEVESNRITMEKLGRAVVPLLEISEPVLASTVKKAVSGYKEIAQTTKRLARMRKLSKTDLKGERVEYNPMEHEMLGGHKPGVRQVKVVRDGIRKEFSGKLKMLIKPWVEPIDN